MGARSGSITVALGCLLAGVNPGDGPCHPERSEGSSTPASMTAEKIPRCARDDSIDTPDWRRLAREIHEETNLLRRDPPGYAKQLERMLPRFEGTMLERPGRPYLLTDEGDDAVREAVTVLKARRPVPPLRWSKGLAAAAADHVADQGPLGGLEHRGSDKSDPADRASRYGRWLQAMAENIAYGENPARDVVMQLLVDDGVRNRGHRKNLLDPKWGAAGVACGPHKQYQQMCVMDYATNYVER